jgi:hypothetical protein
MGEWRNSSTILDLGNGWRWVVSFMPLLLYLHGKSPQYPLDRRLGRPQSQSGHCGGERKSCPCLDSNPGRPAHSLQYLVQCEVLTAVTTNSIIFWDMMPCSPVKVHLLLVPCLAYFLTLETGAVHSSGTLSELLSDYSIHNYFPIHLLNQPTNQPHTLVLYSTDAVSNSYDIVSNNRIKANELQSIWKEAVMA